MLDAGTANKLRELDAYVLYLLGDRIPEFVENDNRNGPRFDEGLLIGVCPHCQGYYAGIWLTVISRPSNQPFDDDFDESALLEGGGHHAYLLCQGSKDIPPGKNTSTTASPWLVERFEDVLHPYDLGGPRVRIDRHWSNLFACEEPVMSEYGLATPHVLKDGNAMWHEAGAILASLLPEALVTVCDGMPIRAALRSEKHSKQEGPSQESKHPGH